MLIILPTRSTPATPQRSAFTLVELLVTIVVIGILAGIVGVVAVGAGQSGRDARTRAMISKIDGLVTGQYETYRSRRAPLHPEVERKIRQDTPSRNVGKAIAEARLYALRELMLMEMPDRWSDVIFGPVPSNLANVSWGQPAYLTSSGGSQYGGPTPLVEAYRRYLVNIVNGLKSRTDLDQSKVGELLTDNQGAECLYMMVMFATADGEARGLFGESSIGDVDGDGAPEFLDGWGRPINFLRWAPGFESDLQLNANRLEADLEAWVQQADADHDPFDMFRADPLAFRLLPLIFSAGPDSEYAIRTIKPNVTWGGGAVSINQNSIVPGRTVYLSPRLTPFQKYRDEENQDYYYGEITGNGAADNLHNHNIASE